MVEENLLQNEPLSKYSTFQIGGPADYFYKAKTKEDLLAALQYFHEKKLPVFVIGAGSNILFNDKGFRGVVIKIEFKNIELQNENLKADAGVAIPTLMQFAAQNNLTGVEKWAGLPGTVGGAVRGNAGCHGLETKDILMKATLINPQTFEIREVNNDYFDFDYRYSKLKKTNEIVLDATFQLQKRKVSIEEQKKMTAEMRQDRISKQPFGATTGSFFKNPSPGKPAGKLIEEAGLKGTTIGKAQISTKHGNFFLNLGGATAKEMLELVEYAKSQVKAKFGIELEEEVMILPEKF